MSFLFQKWDMKLRLEIVALYCAAIVGTVAQQLSEMYDFQLLHSPFQGIILISLRGNTIDNCGLFFFFSP